MPKLSSEQITDTRKQIFEWMVENACGYDQAKPRSLILAYVQEKQPSITDRELRRIVHEMIDENYLIGTGESGYYIIEKPSDLLKAMEYLEAKARSISIRKNELARNFETHFSELADKQLTLLRELS